MASGLKKVVKMEIIEWEDGWIGNERKKINPGNKGVIIIATTSEKQGRREAQGICGASGGGPLEMGVRLCGKRDQHQKREADLRARAYDEKEY